MKGGSDMGKSIYQIALDCSKYASKNVAYFQKSQNGRTWFSVIGADKQYEFLLLALCDLTKVKYPLLSDSLRKHVLQYDLHPVKHQSAIDELTANQKEMDDWDKNHKDKYEELRKYWNGLETGRDMHLPMVLGGQYSRIGSKKNKQAVYYDYLKQQAARSAA